MRNYLGEGIIDTIDGGNIPSYATQLQSQRPLPTTQVRPPTNPYADRDARIAESQRLAAARKAAAARPTSARPSASSARPSASSARPVARPAATSKDSGFDWNAITGIVGSIAGAAKQIVDNRNPQPVAQPEPASNGMGTAVAIGGVVIVGIIAFMLLSGGKKSAAKGE